MKSIKKGLFLSCLFLLTVTCIAIQLFVSPYIGLADNGSFQANSLPVGLRQVDNSVYYSHMTSYFQSTDPFDTGVFSTMQYLIRFAYRLSIFFTGNDDIFDIRWMGGVLFVLYIPSIVIAYALVWRLTAPKAAVAGIAMTFFFMDTYAIRHFNTFYDSATSYVFLLLLLSCMLLCVVVTRRAVPGLVLFLLVQLFLVFFVCVNKRNLWLLPLLAVLICLQGVSVLRRFRRLPSFKWSSAVIFTILAIVTVLPSALLAQRFHEDSYSTADLIMCDILRLSQNPQVLLVKCGLEQDEISTIVPHIGKSVYQLDSELLAMLADPQQGRFIGNFRMRAILGEPIILTKMAEERAQNLFRGEETWGIFPESAGYDSAQPDRRFNFFYSLNAIFLRSNWSFFYVSTVVGMFYYVYEIIKRRKQGTWFLWAFRMVIPSLCLVGNAAVLLTGGHNGDRHVLFIVNILFNLFFYPCIADLACAVHHLLKDRIVGNKTEDT